MARALRPDIADSVTLEAAKDGLRLKIEAGDISDLLAGMNGSMRLVRAAIAAREVK